MRLNRREISPGKTAITKKTLLTPPRKKDRSGCYLRDPSDVRRFLSRIVNDVVSGRISQDLAKSAAYICQTLLRAMEMGEIENRLKALEEKLNTGEGVYGRS